MILKCKECGRVAGDYHHPNCKIRSESDPFVKEHHCKEESSEHERRAYARDQLRLAGEEVDGW